MADPAKLFLSILTLSGEELYSTTVQGTRGDNFLRWELFNRAREKVASGLYVYVLTADDGRSLNRETGKVVVIR